MTLLCYNRRYPNNETAVALRTQTAASNHERTDLSMAASDITIQVPLTKGHIAIVDKCDADLLQFSWQAKINPKSKTVYAQRATYYNKRKGTCKMHRMITERMLGRVLDSTEHVDHIDGDGLNNSRKNLRLTTISQNQQNSRLRVTNTSGYKGVSYSKDRKRWEARIEYDGKQKFLGYFDSPEQAHQAYCEKARELFGEYARFE